MNLFLVGLGGGLGSCARYLLTRTLSRAAPGFPYGTLLSNVLAGLLIGFLIGLGKQTALLPERSRLFLTTGLLGGLSTFSTFSLETVQMLERGCWLPAAGNIALNVGLSLLCVLLGLGCAKVLTA